MDGGEYGLIHRGQTVLIQQSGGDSTSPERQTHGKIGKDPADGRERGRGNASEEKMSKDESSTSRLTEYSPGMTPGSEHKHI